MAGIVVAAVAVLGGCDADPTASVPPCLDVPRLHPSEVNEGRLEDGDARRAGVAIDYYAVIAPDSVALRITMRAPDFDPFLYLLGASGDPLDQAFGPGDDPDAGPATVVLERVIAGACHLVGASGWDRASRGAYTIAVEFGPIEARAPAEPAPAGATSETGRSSERY